MPVLARRGVDPRDPQPAEVALAVAPVAVGVGVRLHQRFLGALVVRVRLAAEALRQLERRAALLLRVHRALDAGHEPEPQQLLARAARRRSEIGASWPSRRLRLADFFSRMWLVKACRPLTLPVPVVLKRFLAPEWVFILGIARRRSMPDAATDAQSAGCRRSASSVGRARPPAPAPRPTRLRPTVGRASRSAGLGAAGRRVARSAPAVSSPPAVAPRLGASGSAPLGRRGAPRRRSPAPPRRRWRRRRCVALSNCPASTAFDGPEHHRHVAPVLQRALLDDAELGELLGEAVEDRDAALGVRHLAAAEHDRHLDLVLVAQEALDVALLGVVVVLGDLRAELDLADRDLLLVLARLLLLLRLLVLVLRVVEHAADRRLGLRARPRRGRGHAPARSAARRRS